MGQSSYSVCAKIQVISPLSSEFLDNGVLYLDTYPEFEVRTTRRLEELIDINKISVDQVIAFDLPRTPKNDAELGDFVNPNRANFNFQPIPVQVIEGGQVISHNLLHVKQGSERDQTYTVELRNDETHWIVGAKKLICREIEDWPEFTINETNIIDNWANNVKYIDGDIGIWFPLVFYGAWFEVGNVKIEDLRPHVHLLALLQRGFSQIGWIFKCPFLESDFGRQLICYLTDPLYGTDEFDKRKNSVRIRHGEQQSGNFSGKVILDFKEYDEFGAYDNTNGEYSAEGVYDLTAEILVNFSGVDPGETGGRFVITLIKKTVNGTEETLGINGDTLFNSTGSASYFTIKLNGVLLSQTDKVYITILVEDNVYGLWQVFFNATPSNAVIFKDGTVLNYPDVFPKTLKLFDVFKGLVHLINGKIDTDIHKRTVTVYAAFTATHFGTEIEGYYKEDTIVNLIDNQIVDSSIISAVDIDQKRYLRIQFKESTDERIKGLNYPKDNPPFSKTYDIGEFLKEETEVSENPFFEPTVNDDIFSILAGPLQEKYLKIGIPFMVDNADGKPSYNIAPRILYAAGDVAIKTPEGETVYWRFNNTTRTTVPFSFQFTTYKKGNGDAWDRYLVYGDREEELFSKFWKRDIVESLYNFKGEILHYSLPKDHFQWSFREYYRFMSRGSQVLGRLIESRDFDGCGNSPTPLTLIPQSNRPDTWTPDPDANNKNCSSQRAKLIVTKTGDTYNFTVDNSAITRNIISQTIRWKYLDEATWTVGTSVTNPTGKFIVQVQTQIEGCPDNFDQKVIDPCGNNFPAIIFSYRYNEVDDENCLTAAVGGLLEDAILWVSTTGAYTSYNGESVVDADVSYDIENSPEVCFPEVGVTKVCFNLLIKFDNDCDPIPVTACYDFDVTPKSCLDNKPFVQCVHFGIGGFGLQLAGSWTSNLQVFFLQYRNIVVRDANGKPTLDEFGQFITQAATENDWRIWDGHSPLFPGTFEARVVVYWCDECPPICSAPVVCLEPEALLSGLRESGTITKYVWDMDNYTWDWNRLPAEEKERANKLYHKQDWGVLMKMHNDYKLSYHTLSDGTQAPFKFCCGEEHKEGIKAWFKKGIDEGII